MKWRPDRNNSPAAEERFKRIATAYAILSDPKKRAKYDARGFEVVAHYTHDDLFGGLDRGSLFGDLGFGFGPVGDRVFNRFFHRARPRPTRGEDIRINAEIPLEIIQQRDSYTVNFSHPRVFGRYGGLGTADGKAAAVCRACGGSSHKVVHRKKQKAGSEILVQQIVTCPECLGGGSLIRTFSLPVGRFQRRGADLWCSKTLSPDEATLVTRPVIPTLDGDVEVKIPAVSQRDEILRLREKGLPRYGAPGSSNLNIRLQIQIPITLTAREKPLYQELRKERTGNTGWS